MILKNRVVLYNTVHKKLDYIEGSQKDYKFIKVLKKGEPDTYWRIPDGIETPVMIECYCLGLTHGNRNITIEREDYEY